MASSSSSSSSFAPCIWLCGWDGAERFVRAQAQFWNNPLAAFALQQGYLERFDEKHKYEQYAWYRIALQTTLPMSESVQWWSQLTAPLPPPSTTKAATQTSGAATSTSPGSSAAGDATTMLSDEQQQYVLHSIRALIDLTRRIGDVFTPRKSAAVADRFATVLDKPDCRIVLETSPPMLILRPSIQHPGYVLLVHAQPMRWAFAYSFAPQTSMHDYDNTIQTLLQSDPSDETLKQCVWTEHIRVDYSHTWPYVEMDDRTQLEQDHSADAEPGSKRQKREVTTSTMDVPVLSQVKRQLESQTDPVVYQSLMTDQSPEWAPLCTLLKQRNTHVQMTLDGTSMWMQERKQPAVPQSTPIHTAFKHFSHVTERLQWATEWRDVLLRESTTDQLPTTESTAAAHVHVSSLDEREAKEATRDQQLVIAEQYTRILNPDHIRLLNNTRQEYQKQSELIHRRLKSIEHELRVSTFLQEIRARPRTFFVLPIDEFTYFQSPQTTLIEELMKAGVVPEAYRTYRRKQPYKTLDGFQCFSVTIDFVMHAVTRSIEGEEVPVHELDWDVQEDSVLIWDDRILTYSAYDSDEDAYYAISPEYWPKTHSCRFTTRDIDAHDTWELNRFWSGCRDTHGIKSFERGNVKDAKGQEHTKAFSRTDVKAIVIYYTPHSIISKRKRNQDDNNVAVVAEPMVPPAAFAALVQPPFPPPP